ncbi:MAG: hypothetical protein BWZ01_02100 [Deltaproteobacteria bacterium ADurb.BinA179]|jgi:hypothetical protein|nr:hypothetical protein [Deltaproteobacteria bacterium]MDI9543738.1 hypothetical protein [Pseudomonadota bacterium]OPZ26432.1 MAG: hypothetical protein BWZ01_02100 [Deltaproteobacteria bacterium ADurb.BinA179]HNU73283.1 hypothetical protein [Deltaproteobacteria bacterium]HOD71591.1 hypothetical protein [Deltaproteobacteria bacterium]
MEHEGQTRTGDVVYFFTCEGCKSQIFWTEINPSVERAARVFKWVRAGCPNAGCNCFLILSAPDRVLQIQDARRLFEEKKSRNEKNVYWI